MNSAPKTRCAHRSETDAPIEPGRASFDVLKVAPEDLMFPFQDQVRPGESGQGYALRMAAENHLNGLPQLKSWLGKSRFATLDALDAPLLHRWFGADERTLEHALGWTQTGRNSDAYVYAGHSLGRSYFLNRSYPRVCPQCLKADGHCRSAWDLTLTVACAEHGTTLSDSCQYCTRSISWNRPAPGSCNCHLEFAPDSAPALATPLELQFAAWVNHHIQRVPGAEGGLEEDKVVTSSVHADPLPLIQLIWPLSLNGGMHVTFALATASMYASTTLAEEPRARTPLRKAQRILADANQVAQHLDQSNELQLRVRRPNVVIQLLADCMSARAPSADRHLAQSLLATVLHQKRKALWSGVNPQLSQLTLF